MEHAAEQAGASPVGRTPAYVSYKTFTTLIEDFKDVGIPPRIDRSVLSRFSGGVGSQLLGALKSLHLMSDEGVPTEQLGRLVNSYGTPNYQADLKVVLSKAYPFLTKIDLTTATPSMFAETFKESCGAQEAVLRKCRTFYLHAARDAGIDIGARLEKGSHPRTSGNGGGGNRRRRKPQKQDAAGGAADTLTPSGVQHAQQKELEYQLIDLMTEPDIDDEVKQSIWALVQYLTARKSKKAAAKPAAAS